MPEVDVQHARLIELKDDLSDVKPSGKVVEVQFNPESLKLSYANQIQTQANGSSNARPPTGNQSQGTPARQFVGTGTSKLAVQLWFDVSAATSAPFMVDDVRRLTGQVLYFMKPKPPAAGARDAAQRTPPGIRFSWGDFLFDGIVESIEENVEFFASTGKALRASMTLNLIQQDILVPDFSQAGDGRIPGTRPLWPAGGGQPLQQMNDAQPGGGGGSPATGGSGSGAGGVGGPGGAGGRGGRRWWRWWRQPVGRRSGALRRRHRTRGQHAGRWRRLPVRRLAESRSGQRHREPTRLGARPVA
jgi:uncharacterized membrane protein YgcG